MLQVRMGGGWKNRQQITSFKVEEGQAIVTRGNTFFSFKFNSHVELCITMFSLVLINYLLGPLVIFHTRQENNGPFWGVAQHRKIPPALEYFKQEEKKPMQSNNLSPLDKEKIKYHPTGPLE